MDAAHQPTVHGALVRLAGHPLYRTDAAPPRDCLRRAAQGPGATSRGGTVPGGGGGVCAVLYWPRHQLLSLHRTPLGNDLVGRRTRREPELPSRRCRHLDAADPCLHGVVLLGVPRQARSLRGLSLMQEGAERRRLVRLAWFALLWLAGVALMALVALLVRAVL